MDYKTLCTLDNKIIKEGIVAYYNNAKELRSIGDLLGQNKKYGQAIALVVLSIEELTKASACTMFYVGETTERNIDAAFKGSLDSKSIHQSRLKYASGMQFLISKVDAEKIKEKFIQLVYEKDLDPKKPFKNHEEIKQWIEIVAKEVFSNISPDSLGITAQTIEELENSFQDSQNWFLHAKTEKEKGIYVDFNNNKWNSPSQLTEADFQNAKKHADDIFAKLSDLLEHVTDTDEDAGDFIRQFMGRLLQNTTA